MVRSTGCSRRLLSVSLFTASRSLRSSDRAHGFAINSPSIPKETDVMNPLAKLTIDAHGGLENWKKFETASAHLVQGGVLWQLKGIAGWLDETNVTVGLRSQWASHSPFRVVGRRSRFEPGLVAIEADDGSNRSVLPEPRRSFTRHTLETPWTDMQLAYFAGYAMWTYLNTPFLLARPGVVCEELSPWNENGESWRRLGVRYPDSIATHSSRQTLYIDEFGLLKRHDYDVEIAGGTTGAHYIEGYVEVSGIKFPTIRRIFARLADGGVNGDPALTSFRNEGETRMPNAAATTTPPIEARISPKDEARCQEILALWMEALNRYDASAMDELMRFPHVRLAAGKVTVYKAPGDNPMDLFD